MAYIICENTVAMIIEVPSSSPESADTTDGSFEERTINHDELATLKNLAVRSGLEVPSKVSCSDLAAQIDVSVQTASRRLRRLEEAELIGRNKNSDGQVVSITSLGEKLLKKQQNEYNRIFADMKVTISGRVTSGLGKGQEFISLDGYTSQFQSKLGYGPFPGTLNVEADDVVRDRFDVLDPVKIKAWTDGDTEYGAIDCYPSRLSAIEQYGSRTAHVIVPKRTDHDNSVVELIAPMNLRESLGLTDGTQVSIQVGEQR